MGKILVSGNKKTKKFTEWLIKQVPSDREIVFLCIGTDRSTGDSLGPFVGNFLKEKGIENVYGTIDFPVHALNLAEKVEYIYDNHKNPFVVAIDATLGKASSIEKISLIDGGLSPGSGVGKDLGKHGDISICPIVNISGFMEIAVLQNTRLSVVLKMANVVADSIVEVITKMREESFTAESACS